MGGKYTFEPEDSSKACKARVSNKRVHFKHCREIGAAIQGMGLSAAISYLENVLAKKEAVPFRVFTGGCGRHAQGKQRNAPGNKCRWPQKASRAFLDLLRNAEANAEDQHLTKENLVVKHVSCQRAPKMRRRTYRAHGRINAYMALPAHIEIVCTEEGESVPKASTPVAQKLTRKQQAIQAKIEKYKQAK